MIKKVTIKLPEQVPPAVSKAFAAIIPGTIAIYTAGIIQFLCTEFLGNGLPELINQYLQIPFQNLSQGLGAIIILVFAVQVFWFFGLHGPKRTGSNSGRWIYSIAERQYKHLQYCYGCRKITE